VGQPDDSLSIMQIHGKKADNLAVIAFRRAAGPTWGLGCRLAGKAVDAAGMRAVSRTMPRDDCGRAPCLRRKPNGLQLGGCIGWTISIRSPWAMRLLVGGQIAAQRVKERMMRSRS